MNRRLFAMAALTAVLVSIAAPCVLAEAFAPVDYRLYPAPEGGYVGDTMPFVTGDGTLEL